MHHLSMRVTHTTHTCTILYLRIIYNVVYNSIHVYYTCTIHTKRYGINHIWENAKKAGEKGRGSQKPSFSNKIQKNQTCKMKLIF